MTLRLNGSTSGYAEIDAPAVAGTTVLTLPTANGTLDRLERAGNILQVVQTLKADRFTTTSGSMVDITGFSVTITPSLASNKILVINHLHFSSAAAGAFVRLHLLRDSTALGLGDTSGSATRVTAGNQNPSNSVDNDVDTVAYTFLDSPNTTSAVTYKWQMSTFSSRTGTFNGSALTTNSNFFNTSSTITVMEVAA